MNLLQFVAIKLTFFLVTGILLGYYLDVAPLTVFILTIIALAIIAILHFRNQLKNVFIIGAFISMASILIGMSSVSVHRAFVYKEQLDLKVKKHPLLWKLKIKEVLKPSSYYQKYIAKVEELDKSSSGGIILCRLKLNSLSHRIQVDDEILVRAPLTEISPPKNPYEFDYKKYLFHKGIEHQIELTENNSIITAREPTSISGWANRTRQDIIEKLQGLSFGTSELAIIKALLLGYRHDIDENVHQNYKEAGALHILAVSGLHVGIILLFIQYLLKPLERLRGGKILKLFLCVLLLWGFAFLAGFSASVVRAVTMFSFLSYALYLNRPGSSFNILALSMFFILLVIDPFLLFQIGFQLSYAAVFSILWIYPKLIKLWTPKHIFFKKAWQLFCVGLAAQAGVLPLSLFYFHQFPGLFFLSNILVVPFLGVIIGMGIMLIFLSLISVVPDFLVTVFNGFILAMNETVAWIASQQAFLIRDIYFDKYHLILSFILIICLVRLLYRFQSKRVVAVFLCIIAIQTWNNNILITTKYKQQLIIAHRIGATILLYQNGTHIQASTNRPEKASRLLNNFRANTPLVTETIDSLADVYTIGKRRLILVGKEDIILPSSSGSDILLLSGSPKINLDRYLLKNRPAIVIADGSNYGNYVIRWKESCNEQDISFHHTGKDGAFLLELK